MQIARRTRLRPEDFLWTTGHAEAIDLETSQCDVGRIGVPPSLAHATPMNELAAHALVRASFLITNIERLVERGDLSTTDAKQLLGQLSSLLARLPSPRRSTAHT